MPTGQQGKLLPLSACTMHWVSCAIRATGVPRVPRRQREDQAHMQEVYPGWSVGDTWEQPFWNQVASASLEALSAPPQHVWVVGGVLAASLLRCMRLTPPPAGRCTAPARRARPALQLSSVTAGKPYHTVHEKTPKEWEAEIGKGYMHNSQEALPIAWPPEWRNVSPAPAPADQPVLSGRSRPPGSCSAVGPLPPAAWPHSGRVVAASSASCIGVPLPPPRPLPTHPPTVPATHPNISP
jgi:hypothetical protein